MKDVKLVPIPKGSITYKSGNAEYMYAVISHSYNKEKGYSENKRKCIGKKVDENTMIPNKFYFMYFGSEVETETEAIPDVSDVLKIGASCMTDRMMEKAGLFDSLSEIFPDEAGRIADQVRYNIISSGTPAMSYESFSFEHPTVSEQPEEGRRTALHPVLRDRLFDKLSQSKGNRGSGATAVLMESPRGDLPGRWSVFAEVFSEQDGNPLFYQYADAAPDASYVIHKVKEACGQYGFTDVTFASDREHFSYETEKLVQAEGCSYVLKVCTQEVFGDAKGNTRLANFFSSGTTKKMTSANGETIFAHSCFSEAAQKKGVQDFNAFLDFESEQIPVQIDVHSAAPYQSEFLRAEYGTDGVLRQVRRNQKEIDAACAQFGHYVLISSGEMSKEEALQAYQVWDICKDGFRKPVNSNEEAFIRFLSDAVRRQLFERIENLYPDYTGSSQQMIAEAISETERIFVTRSREDQYVRQYALTKQQKKIMRACGVTDEELRQYSKTVNRKYGKEYLRR